VTITVLPFASVYVYGVGPPGVTGVVPGGWSTGPLTDAVAITVAVGYGVACPRWGLMIKEEMG
jgi:hypothetical protein